VENSKVGWRVHIHIRDWISEEVNYVKVGWGKLPWFIWWTRVFTWSTSEVKTVWIKPLQPNPDVVNAPFIIHLMCNIFPGVNFNNNCGISNK
jgi:hypothetical protein